MSMEEKIWIEGSSEHLAVLTFYKCFAEKGNHFVKQISNPNSFLEKLTSVKNLT